jgi:ADP-glucose pyrophosphorylase
VAYERVKPTYNLSVSICVIRRVIVQTECVKCVVSDSVVCCILKFASSHTFQNVYVHFICVIKSCVLMPDNDVHRTETRRIYRHN